MSVSIILLGLECSVENQEWSCPDPKLQDDLNSRERRFRQSFSSGPSDPWPDMTSATQMAKAFGEPLKVIRSDPPPEHVPGRVY